MEQIIDKTKELFTKQELEEKAMKLWERYSKRYRDLIPTYQRLLEEKRQKKIKPLNKIRESTLNEVPSIAFLYIPTKKAAESWVKKTSSSALSITILEIELMVDDYPFNTIEAHIFDFKYEIEHQGAKKFRHGLDPDYRSTGSIFFRKSYKENE